MALAQLIYISRTQKKMPLDQIEALVAHSQAANARRDISGALMFVGQHFMQLLEGELSDIVLLFERIRQDPRHTYVHCLYCKNVNKRLHPKWGMRLLELNNKTKLDPMRLERLIAEFREHRHTADYAVEARVLLQDFEQQLLDAA